MVAVGFDLTEDYQELEVFRVANGHPWVAAEGNREMTLDFGVRVQSTKVGITTDGVVVYREGYGNKSGEVWHQVLRDLAQATGS